MKLVSKLATLPFLLAALFAVKSLATATNAQAAESVDQTTDLAADTATLNDLVTTPPELSNLTAEQRTALQHMLDRSAKREGMSNAVESEFIGR